MGYAGVFARWITENGTIRFLNGLGYLLLISNYIIEMFIKEGILIILLNNSKK